MEPIFQQDFPVQELCVDRYGRLKPSTLLYFAQEIAVLYIVKVCISWTVR